MKQKELSRERIRATGCREWMRNSKGNCKFWSTYQFIVLVLALFVLVSVPVASQVNESDRPTSEPKSKGRPGGKGLRSRQPIRSKRRTLPGESAIRNDFLPDLQSYDFKIVKVDAKGKVTGQDKKQAKYFSEDLGDGVMLEMVEILPSTFQMGTADAEIQQVTAEYQRYCNDDYCRSAGAAMVGAETPQHLVKVPPFLIGKYEVTQAQWKAVTKLPRVRKNLNSDPSRFKDDHKPVEQVSWEDAVEFCARLTQKTGHSYRLPTEAEWEYACRAGTTTQFAFGDTILPDHGNFDGTHPYGEAPNGVSRLTTWSIPWVSSMPNEFGLYDMHGNVSEWCQDLWHENYQGAPGDTKAWESGGKSNERVIRGGSWSDYGRRCRSAFRFKSPANSPAATIGFRVVVDEQASR